MCFLLCSDYECDMTAPDPEEMFPSGLALPVEDASPWLDRQTSGITLDVAAYTGEQSGPWPGLWAVLSVQFTVKPVSK